MTEREIVCADFASAFDGQRRQGFRVELIYPADDPHTAVLSRGEERVRLTSRPGAAALPEALPAFVPEFVLTRGGGAGGEGRAGMGYRDLIPSRLGGRYIASHISIAAGGPVADWVHFHRIAFQVIAVRRGWVRVAYEDQGDAFVMHPGDVVLQPPGIRHRVLESSAGLEVVEVTAPALHATFADHQLELPNGHSPDRRFGNQRFVHHRAAEAPWTALSGGGEAQETAIAEATGGLAAVRIIRADQPVAFEPHSGELVFGFFLDGCATLRFRGDAAVRAGDSFVIPPNARWELRGASPDLRLLQVTTARLD